VLNSKGRTSGELSGILQAPPRLPGVRVVVAVPKPMVWRACSKGIVPVDRENLNEKTNANSLEIFSIVGPRGLWIGLRDMDLTHDCLGDRRRVRNPLSSRTCCAGLMHELGFLGATSPPPLGTCQCGGPRPPGSAYTYPNLKKKKKRKKEGRALIFLATKPVFPAGLYSTRYLEVGVGQRAGGPRHGATQRA